MVFRGYCNSRRGSYSRAGARAERRCPGSSASVGKPGAPDSWRLVNFGKQIVGTCGAALPKEPGRN
jgi:hypothetical protein